MVIIFVTFMYGLFIPILFPIALIAIINFYLVETLALTYFYRKPPMLDGALDIKANYLMRYAPIPFFALGYWAIGNAQIFLNIPPILNFINKSPDPSHDLVDTRDGLDQSHLAFIIFFVWLFRISYDSILMCYKKFCQSEAAIKSKPTYP